MKTGKKILNRFNIYLAMILLGVYSGLSEITYLQSFGLAISDVFIRIFRCISTPIIALSIIVTLATYGADKSMNRIWRKTILYTITTTVLAATVSCLFYVLIHPDNVQAATTMAASPESHNVSYLQHVLSIIPTSVFSPFIDHQVMGVLLIGIVIGLAIRHIPDPAAKSSVTNFFKGLHGIFFVITKWIVAILPMGLYGFITATVIELNKGVNMSGIGEYLAVILLANIFQGFVVLPLWLRLNGLPPIQSMRRMMPALSVAFFSKSSAGTLPVTIETAERRLNISPGISRFVLPLCTSLNMNGCAAFIFATVIYLMQNHGIPITSITMASWIVIATIAAIGNAGVPMGCFFLSASLLSSMDVPIVLLGIILPFYNVIDMVETALNVWSDSCVANVIHHKYSADQAGSEPLSQAA